MTQSTRLAACVLLATLLAGTVGRAIATAGKQFLTHDESISYVIATGHGDDYFNIVHDTQSTPYGHWVRADEWMRLVRPEDRFCLGRIGNYMAHQDIHPPLYFWLLHVTCLILGTHLWTGLVLNIVLDLVGLALLYRLARYVFEDPLPASLAALLWYMSPAVFGCSMEGARQYPLLGLCSIGASYYAARWFNRNESPSYRDFVGVVFFGAAGALTHYHFAILVLGISTYAVLHALRNQCRNALSLVAAFAIAYAFMVALHPKFYLASEHMQERQPAYLADFLQRVKFVADTLGHFLCQYWWFDEPRPLRYMATGVVLVTTIFAVFWRLARKPASDLTKLEERTSDTFTESRIRFIIFLAIWNGGATIALYLTFISPFHAHTNPYFAMTWPFLAFVPVILLWQENRLGMMVLTGICLVVFASGLDVSTRSLRGESDNRPSLFFRDTKRVVCNNPTAGTFPYLIWHVPDDLNTFMADTPYLLEHPEEWLDPLQPGDVFISRATYQTTPELEDTLLRLLRKRFLVEEIPKFRSPGRVFKLLSRI